MEAGAGADRGDDRGGVGRDRQLVDPPVSRVRLREDWAARSGGEAQGPPAEFAFTVAESESAEICREVIARFAETVGGTSDQAFVSLCVAAKREGLDPVDTMDQ